ncbi:MAG: hypothetical protein ISS33_00675 [Candidatus Omnitrophica bacterium]|nr:hypothetical protein [Candidatus Omnitrophota bacterium]
MKNEVSSKTKKNRKGMVLAMVLGFLALMVLSVLPLSSMVQQDARLIERVREKEQSRFMAEAGINHALSNIQNDGFAARADFSGALDIGSYSVVFSQVGSRHLVISTGTVNGISEIVSAEISDNTPTALDYFSGAGNDIRINALVANATIVGDIHANNNVYLKAGPVFAELTITGDVSATGIVKEGMRLHTGSWDMLDNNAYINGANDDAATIYEGENRITFPSLDYLKASYLQAATDSGDYYSGNQTFNSASLSPGNGIVYIDGDAVFTGNCTLNGGIIADSIAISGALSQNKTGNKNVILAVNGDIRIRGELSVGEALVYASQDIKSIQAGAEIDINGTMLAGRDIRMWNVLTLIDYNYVHILPEDLMGPDGENSFRLVSWNN